VLQWCDQYQRRCAVAKKLVEPDEHEVAGGGNEGPDNTDADLTQIAAAWNDACHAPGIEVPDSPEAILLAVTTAAKACADEFGLALTASSIKNQLLRVRFGGLTDQAELAIAVTNQGYQRGAFGAQLEALRRAAEAATPVAVRTLTFPQGRACDEAIGKLLKGGGRRAYIDASTLRALAAFQSFQPAFPEARVAAWQRRDRPISTLPPMIELFDLERLRAMAAVEAPAAGGPLAGEARTAATPATGVPVVAAQSESQGTRRVANTPRVGVPIVGEASGPAAGASSVGNGAASNGHGANGKRGAKTRRDTKPSGGSESPVSGPAMSSQLLVGTASTFGAEPRTIEVSSMLRHTGILGSSGSGKTTLALNLIEQLLERGVAVVLVDRKGDLAGYAKPDWWKQAADSERARRLADRLDVRLFTPGTRGGRPLSLTVVPDLQQIPDHERDRMVQYSANALAAMMNLGSGAADNACRAILTQAIAVLAERNKPCGLPELLDLLESRDDQLLARAGRYDDKRFKKLIEDLETVRLNDADLFDPAAEPLTAETLIGRRPGGKVPLAIASTRFLGDVERVQSWVAHLIACLNRYAAKSPSTELRLVFMIDEADVFMPAGAAKYSMTGLELDGSCVGREFRIGTMIAADSPPATGRRQAAAIGIRKGPLLVDVRSRSRSGSLADRVPGQGQERRAGEPLDHLGSECSARHNIDSMSNPNFVPVGGGALALSHRPKHRDVPRLPAFGVTHVVTLLAEREGAKDIGDAVRRAGLTWIWCPLDNGRPPDAQCTAELRPVLAELATLVSNGATILVHCSAGIHRTGMFGYALLRQLGLEPAAARAKLIELRAVTGEGVGDDRLAWGDALSRP
jgi:hypothetical protein